MRGDPPTVFHTLVFNAVTLVGFVGLTAYSIRRARDPRTVARDGLDTWMLRELKNPTRRARWLYLVQLAVVLAAPWVSRYLEA